MGHCLRIQEVFIAELQLQTRLGDLRPTVDLVYRDRIDAAAPVAVDRCVERADTVQRLRELQLAAPRMKRARPTATSRSGSSHVEISTSAVPSVRPAITHLPTTRWERALRAAAGGRSSIRW